MTDETEKPGTMHDVTPLIKQLKEIPDFHECDPGKGSWAKESSKLSNNPDWLARSKRELETRSERDLD